jgi:hypothetical protein
MIRYLKNCFLLLVPILLWNLTLTGKLPPAFQPNVFWHEIPSWISTPETIFRILSMALPAFMILSFQSKQQKAGLAIYLVGTLLYFASWIVMMLYPESSWNQSAVGFLALAYTPILWLIGIGLIGRDTFFKRRLHPGIYITLSLLFILFHCAHAWVVFGRL